MNPPPTRTSTLVYSTESGRICPGCGQSVATCTCKSKTGNVGKGDGTVRVSLETNGRGGKAVTVIRGVPLAAAGLAALGKQLRSACGSGGTLKYGVLEVQGDHVERVIELLKPHGWPVKRAGG